MIDPGLEGKVVLVTGGNNPFGIGAAAARAFAAQGAPVFVHFYRQQGPGEVSHEPGEAFYRAAQTHTVDDLMASLRRTGVEAAAVEADLLDPDAAGLLLDHVERSLGPVEVLINNAALSEPDTFLPAAELAPDSRAADGFPMHTLNAQSHDRHFAVNCRAAALLMAEFARRHVARGASWGRIINISTDGASGFASEVSYGASKHALESYSRAAAKELGRYGVTVNIASLGPIQTGWITPAMEREIAARTPLGRAGRPDDVGDALVLLASEQARWITGQLLYVGGGHRMGL